MSAQSLDPIPSRVWVYVIECQHDTWYVGTSKDLNRRLEEHWTQSASRWTKLHQPVRVAAIHRCEGSGTDVLALEKLVTLDVMRATIERLGPDGWRSVRGGPYCAVDLRDRPRELAAPASVSGG